jgi:peptidyl-prolyl cis-trans isomerase SurA
MKQIFFFFLFSSILLLKVDRLYSQSKIVDEIVAIVGDKMILESDIEKQYYQAMAQGIKPTDDMRCTILENLLSEKLLLNQAEIDSVEVTEEDVQSQLNDRLKYFISQIGSEEKLVKYFNKSIPEIKEDMHDDIRDQLITQKMSQQITENITVTPSEVKAFFNNMPHDSVPYINAKVEVSEIALYPATSDEAIFKVREKLLALRQRILDGENFATLAVLYSEGPSASRGGDIGWATKAELDPEYAKVAFSLKKGQVSKIVESSFGYHIIQLIERNGDRVHTRHILMKPEISDSAKVSTKEKLDSIIQQIRLDSISFTYAAMRYSQDEETRMNGGQLVNPKTGDTQFELDQFNTQDLYVIKDLKVGEISTPYESTDDKGKTVFKVVQLKSRINPHRANLKEDYSMLKQLTEQHKHSEVVDNWITEKLKTTYVKIDDRYKNCNFHNKGWLK